MNKYYDSQMISNADEHILLNAQAIGCEIAVDDQLNATFTGQNAIHEAKRWNKKIAQRKKKSNAQILLRWYYQKRIIPLPKSGSPERIIDNYNIFDFALSEDEMACLDGLNCNFNYLVESLFCPGY